MSTAKVMMMVAPLAMALVAIATMIGLGATVTQNLYNNGIINTTTTVVNQTAIVGNTSNTTLNGQYLEQSTLRVYNTTNTTGAGGLNSSDLLTAGNYTSSRDPPRFRLSAGIYNGSNLSITYDYVNTSVPLSAAAYNNGTVGLGNLSGYLPQLGTLVAATVLISMIGVAFAMGRRQ